MKLVEKIKDKIAGTEGAVLFEEDAAREHEETQIKALTGMFGGQLETKKLEKYLDIDLKFTDFAKPNELPKPIKGVNLSCGYCGAEDKVFRILREGATFATLIFDLNKTILYRQNNAKIEDKIENKKIDEFEALKQRKALTIISEKKKAHYTTQVSGVREFRCTSCDRVAGAIKYSFKINKFRNKLIDKKEGEKRLCDIPTTKVCGFLVNFISLCCYIVIWRCLWESMQQFRFPLRLKRFWRRLRVGTSGVNFSSTCMPKLRD